MIVPDVNLLLYAYNDEVVQYDSARQWWEDLLNGVERVGIPWVVSTGFVRMMTDRRVVVPPISPARAVAYVQGWFGYPHVVPVNPGPQHLTHLNRLLEAAGVGGNLVTDAHLAAIAIEYQAELHSNDSDFARFPGLRWRNPL